MKKEQAHHHKPNIKGYLLVFVALMVLTVVTVLVSYLDLPTGPGIALGLAIATLKASLVAAFFMHLKGERLLIWGLLAATILTALIFVLPVLDMVAINHLVITHPAVEEAAPPAQRQHVP